MDFEVKQEPIEIDGYLLVGDERNFGFGEESFVHNEASSSKKRRISEAANCSFPQPDELIIQDDEMQLLLQQWGLEVLSDRFAKNLIDVSVLDYILDVDIIDLCRDLPIRYRLVLRQKLKQKSYTPRTDNCKTLPETIERKRKNPVALQSQPGGSCKDSLLIETPVPKSRTPQPEPVQTASNVEWTSEEFQTLRHLTLIEICKRYEAGQAFLKEYTTENGKKIYTAESRNNIKLAVVEHFFWLGRGHISKQSFGDMVRIILAELPDEDPRIWYTSSENSTQKGMLYTRYRYLKTNDKRFRRERDVATVPHAMVVSNEAKRSWNKLSENEQAVCYTAKSKLNDVGLTNDVEVISAWHACFPLRRYEVVTGKLQLEEWPVLSTYEEIHELINSDFYAIHQVNPEPIDNRVVDYVDRFKYIYLGYRSLIEEDKLLTSAIWMAASTGFSVSEKHIFLALYVLPLILRPNIVMKDNKRYKPTLNESRTAFIILLESEDSIPETIQKYRRLSHEQNTPLQPYIIAIGSISHEISSYFVILGHIMFKRRSVISALDLLFKLHTVFHLQYSLLCENVLKFIQVYFYDLKLPGDDNGTRVVALISDLNRKANTPNVPSSSVDSCQESRLDDASAPESPTPQVAQQRTHDVITTWHGLTLLEILKQYECGRKFLDQYRIENGKKIYAPESRSYIKHAIVQHFFYLGKGHISMMDLQEMTQIIINELPDEDPHLWYNPGDQSLLRKPKGILYTRYRYMRIHDHTFRLKKDAVTPRPSVSDQAKQGWDALSESERAVCIAAKSKLQNVELVNITDILSAWKECFPLRRYEAVSGSLKFDEWTVLSTYQEIHELINSDYSSIYSAKNESIYDRVLEYVVRFKSIFQGYKTQVHEDKILSETIVSAIAEGFAPTGKNTFLALYVLPSIARTNFVIKGKKRFKPSRWDCRNAFITLLESEDQVTHTIEENIRVATGYNIEPRPFIIAIGSGNYDISRYLVVLGKQTFKCETIISAVELLFKLYIVFHLDYSNLCEGVLKFIQCYFFELVFVGESMETAVAALITDLNRT